MKKNFTLIISSLLLCLSCSSPTLKGEANMLHGCFKDSHIYALNDAVLFIDDLLEKYYKKGNKAANYQEYVKAISDRENTISPLFDKELKKLVSIMRDNRSFFELFTMYELNYKSHRMAAKQGVFSVYMLDTDKPFFKCWENKTENPILKSYLNHYKTTNYIDLNANIWYELDNMNILFETSDFDSPEVRMYVALHGILHLSFMVNPEMMVGIES